MYPGDSGERTPCRRCVGDASPYDAGSRAPDLGGADRVPNSIARTLSHPRTRTNACMVQYSRISTTKRNSVTCQGVLAASPVPLSIKTRISATRRSDEAGLGQVAVPSQPAQGSHVGKVDGSPPTEASPPPTDHDPALGGLT